MLVFFAFGLHRISAVGSYGYTGVTTHSRAEAEKAPKGAEARVRCIAADCSWLHILLISPLSLPLDALMLVPTYTAAASLLRHRSAPRRKPRLGGSNARQAAQASLLHSFVSLTTTPPPDILTIIPSYMQAAASLYRH